jgi:hypothetical protein
MQEDNMDSPSMRALFEGMEEMREELEELKATTVCVWPAGPGSYLKGRVNERKENTGALIQLMKEALIPGTDTKIDRFEGSIPIKNKQDGSPDFKCLFLNSASTDATLAFCGDPFYQPKIKCHEVTIHIHAKHRIGAGLRGVIVHVTPTTQASARL